MPEYPQFRKRLDEGIPITYRDPDILQFSRGRPHYVETANWWDSLSPHDKIWAALEANWRWNTVPFTQSEWLAEQLVPQFGARRINWFVDDPASLGPILTEEQRVSLFQIYQAASANNLVWIDWYSLMTEFKVSPDRILKVGLDSEISVLIEKLLDQWDSDLEEADKDSPFQVRIRDHRFKVPDPRTGDILEPMRQAGIRFNYPLLLKEFKDAPGWDLVKHWLNEDAIFALSELIEEDPELPPAGSPDFYDWIEPETKELWTRFWRSKAHDAAESARIFLGRVFQVPGIPGNEKLNAMQEAQLIGESAQAWADIKPQETRQLTTEEMEPLYEDWEDWGTQFKAQPEEE